MIRTLQVPLILLALAAATPAAAQLVEVGVIGGIDRSDLTVVDDVLSDIGTHGRLGWNLGAVIELGLTERLSLRLVPMYVQGGAKLLLADASGEENPDMDSRMSFLEVPLFLKISLPSRIKPYLAVGPTLAVRLSSTLEFELAGIHAKGDASEITEGLNLGLAAAAGVQHQVGKSTVFFEARYTYGLRDLLRGGIVEFKADAVTMTSDFSDQGEIFTRSLRFQVGATIPFLGS